MPELLLQLGTYIRKPGGNVENLAEQQAAGVAWQLLNIGGDVDRDPTVYDHQRDLCHQHGMPHGPWLHCHAMADVEFAVTTAKAWNSDIVGINIEDIGGDLSLAAVGDFLTKNWTKPVHMATLPWLNNGAGWQHVAFAYQALELFPLEQPFWAQPEIIEQCIQHAFLEGAKRVTLLYSTTSPRSSYPAAVAHCLYTADNVTNWSDWKDTVPQVPPQPPALPVPPKPPGGNVLTPDQKKAFRSQLQRFALVAEKYERNWHYSMARPFTGLSSPMSDVHHDDCSAYAAILFYKAGRASGHPVADPLGYHYSGLGNTGSAYTFLKAHHAPKDKYRVGDIALYLEPGDYPDHMTICRKAGTGTTSVWTSNGTEAGPDARSLHYRGDLTGVYRHPALL